MRRRCACDTFRNDVGRLLMAEVATGDSGGLSSPSLFLSVSRALAGMLHPIRRPDCLVIMGTSLKVAGCKRLVRDMVRGRQGPSRAWWSGTDALCSLQATGRT